MSKYGFFAKKGHFGDFGHFGIFGIPGISGPPGKLAFVASEVMFHLQNGQNGPFWDPLTHYLGVQNDTFWTLFGRFWDPLLALLALLGTMDPRGHISGTYVGYL